MSEVEWASEIRGWLLARLSKHRDAGSVNLPQEVRLAGTPLARWWLLEGQQHGLLDGPLLGHLADVTRRADRLLTTFNRRDRDLDTPEGDVNWLHTLQANAGRPGVAWEWRCTVSQVGLDPKERQLLLGWMRWLAREVDDHAKCWPGTDDAELLGQVAALRRLPGPDAPDASTLRRWAHQARRSRWPLLRQVVADSLRSTFEPVSLDCLPLPTKKWRLFELLCITRVARALTGAPAQVRWLDHRDNRNVLAFDDVTVKYQRTFKREAVLATDFYGGGLAHAVRTFSLRVHNDTDVLITFPGQRAGYDGIILEAKSGNQTFEAAMLQLAAYRAVMQQQRPGRYLVWGVTERPKHPLTADRLEVMRAADGDTWVFSAADEIAGVVERLGLGP